MNGIFSKPDQFINILIGSSDGLMVPLSVFAAMSSAGLTAETITHTGLIILVLLSILMGVGGYLTRKYAELQPRNLIHEEMKTLKRNMNREQTRLFFQNLGLDSVMQEQAIREMDKDESEWNDFLSKYPVDPPSFKAAGSGFIIGLFYLCCGMLMLLPYFILTDVLQALLAAGIAGFLLLFSLGFLKGKFTGRQSWGSALSLAITGIFAAACAFGLIWLISWF